MSQNHDQLAPLWVTGLGMMSCVGYGVKNSCASVRCGISRFGSVPGFSTYDSDEMSAPIPGAPAHTLTQGYVQNAAWLRLARIAMKDLIAYAKLPTRDHAFWRQTALIWILPEITYERFNWPEDQVDNLLREYCLKPLCESLDLPLSTPAQGFVRIGHAGAAHAMRIIQRSLETSPYERAILLGVDSYLDYLCVTQLDEEARLLTAENAAGMIPGEAAACVLVETSRSVQTRASSPELKIIGASFKPFPNKFEPEGENGEGTEGEVTTPAVWRMTKAGEMGMLLAEAVTEAIASAGVSSFHGDVVIDVNGENWRSMAWGTAKSRLAGPSGINWEASNEIVPMSSWGDIGAAAGVAGLCIASRSYTRQYASGPYTLICSISENGDVGAMVVSKGR
ncbi:hypothetical protein [Hahella chejuensis]|uniref:hypothetical protein n=1 Tax=Hahella chejuensis TaxID=158327 RepID=UPI0002E83994|nr:hypothetical protein [Hahella chejuensis]